MAKYRRYVSAPALDVPMTAVLRVQAAIAGLLARLVPNLRMVPAAPLHKLSKCQAALDAYKNDPMIKVNPKPYTLHPTPYTLHPTPYTLNPKP